MGTFEAKFALTLISGAHIHAGSVVSARLSGTMVIHVLAIRAVEAGRAFAFIAILLISTSSTIQTGHRNTIIYIHVAGCTSPAWFAHTLPIEQRIHTEAILAWVRLTQILFDIAALANESMWAIALEVIDEIVTSCTQCAWFVGTIINVVFTILSLPAGQAFALVSS